MKTGQREREREINNTMKMSFENRSEREREREREINNTMKMSFELLLLGSTAMHVRSSSDATKPAV